MEWHSETFSIAMTQKADSKGEFLFKDSYFEDLEFVYEPSFLQRQLSEQSEWDWEDGGKKMSKAKHICQMSEIPPCLSSLEFPLTDCGSQ